MSHLDFIQELTQENIPFIQNESGSRLTTAATGGFVSTLVVPDDVEQLVKTVKLSTEFKFNLKIIGNGSNLLIPDVGIRDTPVIKLGRGFKYTNINGEIVLIGASSYLPSVSREICKAGLSGLEFAGGIPASVGGAVRMNAGAHGGDMSQVITEVNAITLKGDIVTFKSADINWGYRHSDLPSNIIVTSVKLKLFPKSAEEIEEVYKNNLDDRKKHQPLQYASFGSVFKNPNGLQGSAGKLIESIGLKGYQIGDAMISKMHANWIVNPNKRATTSDMIALIKHAQHQVKLKCGIDLEPEVIRW